ncbi:hypothetical protein [Helicobacter pylori]|uniref:hypothetical protein n=1 Tax=Helicobacter pylori TaxID=210 RepID=UPI0035690220
MDTIFLKIKIKKTDQQAEELRARVIFCKHCRSFGDWTLSNCRDRKQKAKDKKRQKINDKS